MNSTPILHAVARHRLNRNALMGSLACAMALLLCAGTVMSFLSATDSVENKLSIAKELAIEIVEPSWDLVDADGNGIPDKAQGLLPNQALPKDPTVKNLTSIESYLIVQVKVPAILSSANDGAASCKELFAYDLNPDWSESGTGQFDAEGGYVVHTYMLTGTLGGDSTSSSVFDEVRVSDYAGAFEETGSMDCSIDIIAHAIQKEGFESAEEAWRAYLSGQESSEPSQVSDFAIYSATDNSLRMYKRPVSTADATAKDADGAGQIDEDMTLADDGKKVPAKGNTYNGLLVSEVYPGIEQISATSKADVPWNALRGSVQSVIVEDALSPHSVSFWCADMNLANAEFSPMITSSTVGMEGVFMNNPSLSLDCSDWDATQARETADFNFGSTGVISPFSMPEAFAIFTEDDSSLRIYKRSNVPSVGDAYDGLHVTNVYRNLEGTQYLAMNKMPWYGIRSRITKAIVVDKIAPKTCAFWFLQANDLESVDLEMLDTSKCTSMASMFCQCRNVQGMDLSAWDTQSVQTMSEMFSSCSSLESLDISNFSGESLTDISDMFKGCSKLESLDMSGLHTPNLTNAMGLFYDCKALRNLDISSLSTASLASKTILTLFSGTGIDWLIPLERVSVGESFDMGYAIRRDGSNNPTYKWQDVETGTKYGVWDVPKNRAATYEYVSA